MIGIEMTGRELSGMRAVIELQPRFFPDRLIETPSVRGVRCGKPLESISGREGRQGDRAFALMVNEVDQGAKAIFGAAGQAHQRILDLMPTQWVGDQEPHVNMRAKWCSAW